MKTFNNQKVVRPGMSIYLITIPNPDPREPSPDSGKLHEDSFSDENDRQADPDEDDHKPNTDLSGIKDDRTHDPDQVQAEQEDKEDDKPDLSGDINL